MFLYRLCLAIVKLIISLSLGSCDCIEQCVIAMIKVVIHSKRKKIQAMLVATEMKKIANIIRIITVMVTEHTCFISEPKVTPKNSVRTSELLLVLPVPPAEERHSGSRPQSPEASICYCLYA